MISVELISVIVPVYKVEPYLDRCVASIVAQTYKNLEIILVDDGSPDNCPQMCDAWAKKDDRIKVIHKQNGGLSDARNAGMAAARGEFIGFVDADDYISPDMYEQLCSHLINDDSDIAACDFLAFADETEINDDSCPIPKSHTASAHEAMSDIVNNRNFRAVAWNKLYRKDLLDGMLFEVGKLHEDEFFTYKVIDRAKQLVYVDRPLYFYRQRPESIMTRFSCRRLDLLDAYVERIKLLEIKYSDLAKKDKINFCIACVNCYYEMSNSDEKKRGYDRISECRKRIRVSFKDLCSYPAKEKLYVVLSKSRKLSIAFRRFQTRRCSR